MPLFLRKLGVKDFTPDRPEPNEQANAWKLVALCETDDVATCIVLRLMHGMETQFRLSAISGFLRLVEVAANGMQLASAYDNKRCHEVLKFQHEGRSHKLFRIRQGDTRIVFCYGPNREICVCSVIVKKEDKFSRSDLSEFSAVAKRYLDGFKMGAIKFVTRPGEKR